MRDLDDINIITRLEAENKVLLAKVKALEEGEKKKNQAIMILQSRLTLAQMALDEYRGNSVSSEVEND